MSYYAIGFCIGALVWCTFATLVIVAMCVELRRLRAHVVELADLIALLAESGKDAGGFIGDCRDRIERLERLARIPTLSVKGPN